MPEKVGQPLVGTMQVSNLPSQYHSLPAASQQPTQLGLGLIGAHGGRVDTAQDGTWSGYDGSLGSAVLGDSGRRRRMTALGCRNTRARYYMVWKDSRIDEAAEDGMTVWFWCFAAEIAKSGTAVETGQQRRSMG